MGTSFIRAMLLASVSVTAAVGVTPTAAHAQEQSYDINIPAQSLGDAIRALGRSTRQNIVFDGATVRGKRSVAVRGNMTPAEALDRMLSGSGLVMAKSASGSLTVRLGNGQGGAELASSSGDDAGQNEKGISEILVVGSRSQNVDIRRTEDDPQPYVVFDSREIEQSGATSVEDFLKKRLAMNTVSATPSQSGAGHSESKINLRGLGIAQTLILIDGRRQPRYLSGGGSASDINNGTLQTFAQTDINGIPLSTIERIEILPSTAGGIYGGGAIGGVVNIVRKRDYNGLTANVGFDGTFRGGGETFRAELTGGFALEGGKTQISISASHAATRPLYARSNKLAVRGQALLARNDPLGMYAGNFAGSTPNIRSLFGDNLSLKSGAELNSPVTFVPLGYTGFNPADPSTAQPFLANAGKRNAELSDDSRGRRYSLYSNPRVQSLNLNIRRKFSSWVDVFADFNYSDNYGRGYSSTPLLGTVYLAPNVAANPFNQFIQIDFPVPGVDQKWTTRIKNVAGTAGVILRLPGNWTADLEYQWSRSTATDTRTGMPLTSEGSDALNSGVIGVLRDPAVSPIDFSPYLLTKPDSGSRLVTNQRLASARVGGTLTDLPAGPVSLTMLAEHRFEGAPESTSVTIGPGFAIQQVTLARSQSADSAYAELRFPFFSDRNAKPFLQSLELQASARYDRYTTRAATPISYQLPGIPSVIDRFSVISHSTDYTIAFLWAPSRDLRLRASYATGFLPPAINQIAGFAPYFYPVGSFGTDVDPKRNNEPLASVVPYAGFSGGNPDLRPETSASLSFGAVITPRFLEGLRFSLDYSQIQKKNEIVSLNVATLLAYEEFFSGRVLRDPPSNGFAVGPITRLDGSLVNLAESKLRVLDFQVDYEFGTEDLGAFHFYAIATNQSALERRVLPQTLAFDLVGFQGGPLKWKGNLGLDWSFEQFKLGWNVQYFDSYELKSSDTTLTFYNDFVSNLQNGRTHVPSQIYNDLYMSFTTDKNVAFPLRNMTLSFGIQNVFDKKPPVLASYSPAGAYSQYGDPRLRRYTLRLTKGF